MENTNSYKSEIDMLHRIKNRDLGRKILHDSDILPRASFYSGRGVNRGDLDEKKLRSIYLRLYKLNGNYAGEFVRLVREMKTLGASEFITNFLAFASNGFKIENLQLDDSNISVDDLDAEGRDMVALLSILSTISRGDDMQYQITESETIKWNFLNDETIQELLKTTNPELSPYSDDDIIEHIDHWAFEQLRRSYKKRRLF